MSDPNFHEVPGSVIGWNYFPEPPKKTEMNYPYIRAWGLHAGQWRDFIDRQVEMAVEENAPEDAVYRDDGRWVCIGDIQHKATRDRIIRRVQSLTAK